jgi:LmbE family N-acetylglucosaminyl deacetylase
MEIVIYVAHVDDETIFAGGSIAKWTEQGHIVHIVYAGNGIVVHGRPGHDYRKHAGVIAESYGVGSYHFLNIPTMEFERYGQLELNKRFLELGLNYDCLVTHNPDDVNTDHTIVFQSARVLSRYSSIRLLCMDSIGSVSDFSPTFFVDISDFIDKKMEAMRVIETEIHSYPHERSYLAIKAKDMYRGSQINCKFAEAFEVKKWVI